MKSQKKQYIKKEIEKLKVKYPFLQMPQLKGKALATWKRKKLEKEDNSLKNFRKKSSVNYSSSLQRPLSIKFQTATTFSDNLHGKSKESKTNKISDPKASDSDCSDIQKLRKCKRKAPILMSDSEQSSDDNWGSFVDVCRSNVPSSMKQSLDDFRQSNVPPLMKKSVDDFHLSNMLSSEQRTTDKVHQNNLPPSEKTSDDGLEFQRMSQRAPIKIKIVKETTQKNTKVIWRSRRARVSVDEEFTTSYEKRKLGREYEMDEYEFDRKNHKRLKTGEKSQKIHLSERSANWHAVESKSYVSNRKTCQVSGLEKDGGIRKAARVIEKKAERSTIIGNPSHNCKIQCLTKGRNDPYKEFNMKKKIEKEKVRKHRKLPKKSTDGKKVGCSEQTIAPTKLYSADIDTVIICDDTEIGSFDSDTVKPKNNDEKSIVVSDSDSTDVIFVEIVKELNDKNEKLKEYRRAKETKKKTNRSKVDVNDDVIDTIDRFDSETEKKNYCNDQQSIISDSSSPSMYNFRNRSIHDYSVYAGMHHKKNSSSFDKLVPEKESIGKNSSKNQEIVPRSEIEQNDCKLVESSEETNWDVIENSSKKIVKSCSESIYNLRSAKKTDYSCLVGKTNSREKISSLNTTSKNNNKSVPRSVGGKDCSFMKSLMSAEAWQKTGRALSNVEANQSTNNTSLKRKSRSSTRIKYEDDKKRAVNKYRLFQSPNVEHNILDDDCSSPDSNFMFSLGSNRMKPCWDVDLVFNMEDNEPSSEKDKIGKSFEKDHRDETNWKENSLLNTSNERENDRGTSNKDRHKDKYYKNDICRDRYDNKKDGPSETCKRDRHVEISNGKNLQEQIKSTEISRKKLHENKDTSMLKPTFQDVLTDGSYKKKRIRKEKGNAGVTTKLRKKQQQIEESFSSEVTRTSFEVYVNAVPNENNLGNVAKNCISDTVASSASSSSITCRKTRLKKRKQTYSLSPDAIYQRPIAQFPQRSRKMRRPAPGKFISTIYKLYNNDDVEFDLSENSSELSDKIVNLVNSNKQEMCRYQNQVNSSDVDKEQVNGSGANVIEFETSSERNSDNIAELLEVLNDDHEVLWNNIDDWNGIDDIIADIGDLDISILESLNDSISQDGFLDLDNGMVLNFLERAGDSSGLESIAEHGRMEQKGEMKVSETTKIKAKEPENLEESIDAMTLNDSCSTDFQSDKITTDLQNSSLISEDSFEDSQNPGDIFSIQDKLDDAKKSYEENCLQINDSDMSSLDGIKNDPVSMLDKSSDSSYKELECQENRISNRILNKIFQSRCNFLNNIRTFLEKRSKDEDLNILDKEDEDEAYKSDASVSSNSPQIDISDVETSSLLRHSTDATDKTNLSDDSFLDENVGHINDAHVGMLSPSEMSDGVQTRFLSLEPTLSSLELFTSENEKLPVPADDVLLFRQEKMDVKRKCAMSERPENDEEELKDAVSSNNSLDDTASSSHDSEDIVLSSLENEDISSRFECNDVILSCENEKVSLMNDNDVVTARHEDKDVTLKNDVTVRHKSKDVTMKHDVTLMHEDEDVRMKDGATLMHEDEDVTLKNDGTLMHEDEDVTLKDDAILMHEDEDVTLKDDGALMHEDEDVTLKDDGILMHEDEDVTLKDDGALMHKDEDVMLKDEGTLMHEDEDVRMKDDATLMHEDEDVALKDYGTLMHEDEDANSRNEDITSKDFEDDDVTMRHEDNYVVLSRCEDDNFASRNDEAISSDNVVTKETDDVMLRHDDDVMSKEVDVMLKNDDDDIISRHSSAEIEVDSSNEQNQSIFLRSGVVQQENDRVRVQNCSQTKSENVNTSLINGKNSISILPLEVLKDVTRYCVSVQTSFTDVNSEIITSHKNSCHIKQSCCVHAVQSSTTVDRTNVSSGSQRISSKTYRKMSMVAETLVRNIGDKDHDWKPLLKSVKASCTAEPLRAFDEPSETSSYRISDSESEVESERDKVCYIEKTENKTDNTVSQWSYKNNTMYHINGNSMDNIDLPLQDHLRMKTELDRNSSISSYRNAIPSKCSEVILSFSNEYTHGYILPHFEEGIETVDDGIRNGDKSVSENAADSDLIISEMQTNHINICNLSLVNDSPILIVHDSPLELLKSLPVVDSIQSFSDVLWPIKECKDDEDDEEGIMMPHHSDSNSVAATTAYGWYDEYVNPNSIIRHARREASCKDEDDENVLFDLFP